MPRHKQKKQPDIQAARRKLDLTNCRMHQVKKGLWIAVNIGEDIAAAITRFKHKTKLDLPIEARIG
jgi:hypothetical protein